MLYALVQHPLSALWVALLFLGIQQLEGHVIVPKVMGHSLRLHPLLVIFGLLAGGEIYGFPGILVALPLLAAGARRVGVLRRARRARRVGTTDSWPTTVERRVAPAQEPAAADDGTTWP